MPITPITPPQQIDRAVEAYLANVRRAILYKMHYAGERCVIEARKSADFTDRTGNLRSSMGYVIIEDGKIVDKGGFSVVSGTNKKGEPYEGSKGSAEGAKFISQIVAEFPKGIVLVVCAGMKYAASVAAKGFNVIDSAELLAERLVPQILTQLGLKIA